MTLSIPLIPILIVVVFWIFGLLAWFIHQDNRHESDVLFNLTFGLITWPLLLLAHMIARRS